MRDVKATENHMCFITSVNFMNLNLHKDHGNMYEIK